MRKKRQISHPNLQKKYAGKIVALSQKEDKVLAAGKDVVEVEKELKKRAIHLKKQSFGAQLRNTVAPVSIKFPYFTKIIEEGKIPDPRALIQVETLHGPRIIKFIIDSGADTTILPFARYGAWFKIDVSPKNKTSVGGIGDEKIYGYPGWNKYSILFDNRNKESVFKKLES